MHWISDHIQLGDLPTWLAAVGAAVAAVFAFGQLKALRTQVNLQRADLAKVEETQRQQAELLALEIRDRREAQARMVTITSPGTSMVPQPNATAENGKPLLLHRQVCLITNASSSAIAEVNVSFRFEEIHSGADLAFVVPQARFQVAGRPRENVSPPVDRIDPGATIRFESGAHPIGRARSTTYEVVFKDAAGRRWKVDCAGQLHERR